jgi:pimeloyl-ACP methyl ester carboxylesterase
VRASGDSTAHALRYSEMPALVLIPGLLCDQRLWNSQMLVLKEYVDITVADITEQDTISGMAEAVLENAPVHFSLAGFSLGSQVALEIMRVASGRVTRLALLSATAGGVPPAVNATLQQAIQLLEQGHFVEYFDAVYSTYVSPSKNEDQMLKATFINMARAVGREAGLRQMRALRAINGPIMNLGEIRCQTAVIGGREDRRTTPEAQEQLAKGIPGAELVIVENAGHFAPLEQPGAVSEAMERWIME